MASSADYFVEVGVPGSATTLSTPAHAIGGATFKAVSLSGFPAVGKAVIFAVDTYTMQTINGVATQVRNAGSYTEWEAVVTDATTLSNAVVRFGSDQAYAADGMTRIYIPITSARENRLIQGILVEHSLNGTHGNITTSSISNNGSYNQSSGAFNIPNNAINANEIATNAITLGSTQITSSFATASTTAVQITGLSVSVTIPAGGRQVEIEVYIGSVYQSTANTNLICSIWDGAVGTGIQLATSTYTSSAGTAQSPMIIKALVTPGTGSKTYNVSILNNGGSQANVVASTAQPAYILVKAI